MFLIPVSAFVDHCLWLLHGGKRALVVDPGDTESVLRTLQASRLQLESILVTHHRPDHTGGGDALRQASGAAVYGPAPERIPAHVQPLHEGDQVTTFGLDLQVMHASGHSAGHIAFYSPDMAEQPLLFCSNTLFSGCCSQLIEGTPAQMLTLLVKLAALPSATRICCAYKYTLANSRFALAVEPDNAQLAAYEKQCHQLRKRGKSTRHRFIG